MKILREIDPVATETRRAHKLTRRSYKSKSNHFYFILQFILYCGLLCEIRFIYPSQIID